MTAPTTAVLDEFDLALVHALQIAPRASFEELGAVLGCAAVTAARRWRRLRGQGLAWVTGSGSPQLWTGMAGAVVRIDVAHRTVDDVVARLAGDPRTKSVYRLVGSDAVLAHAVAADHARLRTWLRDVAGALPGVRTTDTRLITGTHREASTWRLDVLSPAQQQALRISGATRAPTATSVHPDRIRPLLRALGVDGRADAAAIARSTGWSRSTVQRRLADLDRGGLLAVRCDVSQESVGYPVTLWLFGSVDATDLAAALHAIAALPQVRLLLTTTGPDNVLLGAWLRRVEHVLELELRLAEVAPALRVRQREVALRTAKIQGWVLDDTGRAARPVPIDPWADAPPRGPRPCPP